MKKIYTFILTLLCSSSLLVAQNIYFSEDFENGLPTGWEVTGDWQVGNSDDLSSDFFNIPNHTDFLCFNDDANGQGSSDDAGRAMTPSYQLPTFTTSIWLSISTFYEEAGNQSATISISDDDGLTWTVINTLLEETNNWELLISEIPPSFSGKNVRFAFDFDDGDGWNHGWCIDDMEIREYYQRDVRFDYNNKEAFFSGAEVGALIYGGGGITNLGLININSLDLNLSANGTTITETISGLDIGFNEPAFVQMSTPFTMIDGTVDFTFFVSNVNGLGDDEDVSNDTGQTYAVTSVIPHPDRGILVEESTSPPCTWCPRGAVYMDGMTQRYPNHFVGVAVHSNAPLADDDYQEGMEGFGVFAQPITVFNRQEDLVDPSDLEQPFLDLVTSAPVATLDVAANYNNASKELTVSVEALFTENVPTGYAINAVIVEDSVRGSGGFYNQSNGYSGDYDDPMDIFTVWPKPVPSSLMHYNHVGRKILAGWDGITDGLENGASAGETIGTTFAPFTVLDDYHLQHIHIAAMLIADDGTIANAKMVKLEELGISTSMKEFFNHDLISVFPNPTYGSTNIKMNLKTTSEVSLQVYDAFGRLVAQKNYRTLNEEQVLPFSAALEAGTYLFRVRLDEQVAVKRVLVIE